MIETLALAALGGAIVGLLLAAFGGGGSVLATPWLIYVVGIADVHVAIGTSASRSMRSPDCWVRRAQARSNGPAPACSPWRG
jgi:hypothetical protein